MARLFWATLGLIFSYSATLHAVLGDEFEEIEHLWLTQNVHVSAEYLCQDGVYIYFKDEEACTMATPSMTCTQSKRISPINYIEKVELPNGAVVTQFFTIPTAYQYSKYELSGYGPIKTYDLVESKQIPLPVCAGKKKLPVKKVRKIRKANKAEAVFMQGMIDSGVSIVNSPYGVFDPESLFEFEQNFVNESGPQIKSPLCSKKLNYKELVNQASGEWSGNGIVKLESLAMWQKESSDLYIHMTKDQNNNVKYEFFCRDEVENE